LIKSGSTRKYLLYAIGEIALVVIGILIALQVNNWNEQRKIRSAEIDSIAKLHDESELIVAFFKQDLKQANGWLSDGEYAAKVLNEKSLANIDTIRFIYGVGVISVYPAITPPRSVFDELNTSGKFMQISSDSIRAKIMEYYAQLDYTRSQLNYFRQTVRIPEELATEDFYAVYDPNIWSKRKWHIQLDNLFENKAFITSHIDGLRNLIMFNRFRKDALQKAGEMCVMLGEASGTNCSLSE